MPPRPLLLAALVCLASLPVRAQRAATAAPTGAPIEKASCGYLHCALGIAPVWNGLAIVQGPERTQVANLHFFWPHHVDAAFVGDSALASAARAVHTRRVAAVLTDAGGLLLAAAAVRVAQTGHLGGSERALAIAGAGAFVMSVPLHFSADGWLSRAVWWHNAAFGR
jgi:hypothetical protein